MHIRNRRLTLINLEYALIQGLYWVSFCGIVTYAAVSLQARGYSNTALGQILAVGYILGFLIPQLLANVIDRSDTITVYHCQWLLLALQTVLVLLLKQYPGRGAVISVLSCLLIASEITLNPMNTSISTDLEHRIGHINYGAARGTGSIAFAPFTILLGKLVEDFGTGILPGIYLLCIALQAAALLLLSLSIRRFRSAPVGKAAGTGRSFAQFARQNKHFFGLLAGIALLFFTHNLVNNYQINVVRNVGGDTSDMGIISGFAAFMEIPMMFFYDRLLRRFRCESTVRFASLMFVAKALAVAFAGSMGSLLSANLLQTFSFAMITPAMVAYVNLYIDPRDSAKGQALAFGMVTLGNILSTAVGGRLYDSLSVHAVLIVGACAALLGSALCHAFSRPARQEI